MKIIAGCLVGILALVGLGAGAVAMGLVNVPFFPTATGVQGSPALQPLNAQTANNADMIVTLSERYLNRQLAAGLPSGGQISNVQLDVHENNRADINATAQVNNFFTVRPKVSMLLRVQNGQIVIDIQSVDVGGFGIPSSLIEPQIAQLKQQAESQLNAQLANLATSSGLKLQDLSTTENSLTLDFVQ